MLTGRITLQRDKTIQTQTNYNPKGYKITTQIIQDLFRWNPVSSQSATAKSRLEYNTAYAWSHVTTPEYYMYGFKLASSSLHLQLLLATIYARTEKHF